MNLQDLNKQFALPKTLEFAEKENHFKFVKIQNKFADASIAIQGAHIMTYQPKGERPVIWLSMDAKFINGKSIRGGVPVCWPWFGPHATQPDFPAHGYARTMEWEVTQTTSLPDGSTFISFVLPETEITKKYWPNASRLEMHITVGSELKIEMITTNQSDKQMLIGEALHTYFHVSDIEKIKILGLENCQYMDKVGTPGLKKQEGPITIHSEVDRVYLNTTTDCIIEDLDWQRKIIIQKEGSQSTVIWNPWIEKAEKMGDLGALGYKEMVCVESGNALDNVILVEKEHKLTVRYKLEKI